MAKLTKDEVNNLALEILFNPPDLATAAEEIDPAFEGGFTWQGEVKHTVNTPGFTSVDQFEYLESLDNPAYVPPAKELILQKWTEKYHEYCAKYYQLKRKVAFEALEEQLDKLYHDVENGFFGEEAKKGSFFNYIKEVKASIPKE